MPIDTPNRDDPTRVGPYRTTSKLGSGGVGHVYRAEDTRSGAIVALKLLREERLASPRDLERFRREADVARRIEHPNCARLLDAGESDGRPYVAYEIVEGRGLDEILGELRAEGGRLSAQTALDYALQIASALEALHAAGWVHRDVKPSNVRITADGRAVLLDFGLATTAAMETLTRTGEFAGSLPYAPPEQIQGGARNLDERADVYALAATLHECVTGLPVFTGASLEQVIISVVRDEPLPASRIDPTLPRSIDLVLAKALEKDPRDRYATMREFSVDLHALQDGQAVTARGLGPFRSLVRAARKRPILATILVAASILILVVPSALYVQQSRNRARLEREGERTRLALDRAEENLTRALEAVESMVESVSAPAMRATPGSKDARFALIDDAIRSFADLLTTNPDDPRVLYGYSHALRRNAVLRLRLGDHETARELLDRVLPMCERLIEIDPLSADYRIDLADSLQARADLQAFLGDAEAAESDMSSGIAHLRRAAELAPDRTEPARGIASFLTALGSSCARRGDTERAEVLYEEAASIMAGVIASTNAVEDMRGLAQVKNNLATMFDAAGRRDAAIEGFHEVIAIHEKILEVNPGDRDVRRDRAATRKNLATTLSALGRHGEAATLAEGAAIECEELLVEEPGNALVSHLLGLAYTQLAGSRMRLGKHPESDEAHDRAVVTLQRLTTESPAVPQYSASLGTAYANRAIHHQLRKRFEPAREDYAKAVESLDRALLLAPDAVAWSSLKEQVLGLADKLPPPDPPGQP